MLKFLSLFALLGSISSFAFDCISDLDQDGYFSSVDKIINAKSEKICKRVGGIFNTDKYKGDCDGNNAKIYPRARELSDNFDNDCDRNVDEPEMIYSERTPNTSSTPLFNQLTVKLNSETQLKLLSENKLYYQLTLINLHDSSNTFLFPAKSNVAKATSLQGKPDRVLISQTELSKLLAFNTAYQISIKFYDANKKKVGATSDLFYNVTNDSSLKPSKLDQLRTKTVLMALTQYQASQRGEIGTNGTIDIDGTRFGAPVGGSWCDEFYASIVKAASNHQGFYRMNPDNVPNYFKDPLRDGIWIDQEETILGVDNSYFDDGRGKWDLIFYDPEFGDTTTGARGDMLLGPKHIMMFFAFDQFKNIVYTIEGNVSNKVYVRQHLTMPGLDDPMNPTSERNYLLGIGRLQVEMFSL